MSGCGGTGVCACAARSAELPADGVVEPLTVARANGVALHRAGEQLSEDGLRQRACTELLRQQAQLLGLLSLSDVASDDGVASAEASAAIEQLLEQDLQLPTPDETACRRHFAAHHGQYSQGEQVHARHILFAVTPGVEVTRLRKRAEGVLIEVRANPAIFAARAAELSNCPTGAEGGALGWLETGGCAPEFARELFGHAEVGVLPRLVHSRFGLHIVEVLEREPGIAQPFEAVRGAVAMALRQRVYVTALRQYLRLLAGEASVEGVELDAADTPLVQ